MLPLLFDIDQPTAKLLSSFESLKQHDYVTEVKVDCDSGKQILNDIEQTFVNQGLKDVWVMEQLYLLHDLEDIQNFMDKKAELIEKGRNGSQLRERLAFAVCYDDSPSSEIKFNRSNSQSMPETLGQLLEKYDVVESGVGVLVNADVALKYSKEICGMMTVRILVFKILSGRTKLLLKDDPEKKVVGEFESVCLGSIPQPSDTLPHQVIKSSLYMSYGVDKKGSSVPYHCLPFALVKFRCTKFYEDISLCNFFEQNSLPQIVPSSRKESSEEIPRSFISPLKPREFSHSLKLPSRSSKPLWYKAGNLLEADDSVETMSFRERLITTGYNNDYSMLTSRKHLYPNDNCGKKNMATESSPLSNINNNKQCSDFNSAFPLVFSPNRMQKAHIETGQKKIEILEKMLGFSEKPLKQTCSQFSPEKLLRTVCENTRNQTSTSFPSTKKTTDQCRPPNSMNSEIFGNLESKKVIEKPRFHGRTLLKGGSIVRPRNIPLELIEKPGVLNPVDPRNCNISTKEYDFILPKFYTHKPHPFKCKIEIPENENLLNNKSTSSITLKGDKLSKISPTEHRSFARTCQEMKSDNIVIKSDKENLVTSNSMSEDNHFSMDMSFSEEEEEEEIIISKKGLPESEITNPVTCERISKRTNATEATEELSAHSVINDGMSTQFFGSICLTVDYPPTHEKLGSHSLINDNSLTVPTSNKTNTYPELNPDVDCMLNELLTVLARSEREDTLEKNQEDVPFMLRGKDNDLESQLMDSCVNHRSQKSGLNTYTAEITCRDQFDNSSEDRQKELTFEPQLNTDNLFSSSCNVTEEMTITQSTNKRASERDCIVNSSIDGTSPTDCEKRCSVESESDLQFLKHNQSLENYKDNQQGTSPENKQPHVNRKAFMERQLSMPENSSLNRTAFVEKQLSMPETSNCERDNMLEALTREQHRKSNFSRELHSHPQLRKKLSERDSFFHSSFDMSYKSFKKKSCERERSKQNLNSVVIDESVGKLPSYIETKRKIAQKPVGLISYNEQQLCLDTSVTASVKEVTKESLLQNSVNGNSPLVDNLKICVEREIKKIEEENRILQSDLSPVSNNKEMKDNGKDSPIKNNNVQKLHSSKDEMSRVVTPVKRKHSPDDRKRKRHTSGCSDKSSDQSRSVSKGRDSMENHQSFKNPHDTSATESSQADIDETDARAYENLMDKYYEREPDATKKTTKNDFCNRQSYYYSNKASQYSRPDFRRRDINSSRYRYFHR